MRTIIAGVCMCCCASSVAGMLTISSFRAGAGTNAFAPLDKSKYFDEHYVENLSPAIVNASGDWLGTNFGGMTDTWHWVGTARAYAATVMSDNHLVVAGSGTFSRQLTTTADFVNPNNSAIGYAPGSGVSYSCTFAINASAAFSAACILEKYGGISLYSVTQGAGVFNRFNPAATSLSVNENGVLTPGTYTIAANAGSGGVSNQGASTDVRAGGFRDFLFTVQVPEPADGVAMALAGGMLVRRRQR